MSEDKRQVPKVAMSLKTLKIYGRHALVYWKTVLICIVGVCMLIGADLLSPYMYKKFFDLLTKFAADRSNTETPRILSAQIRTIIYVALTSWVGWRICMYSIVDFESKVMRDLSNSCFEYLHRHSYRFFTDHFAGSLVKRVNRFSAGFEIVADQFLLQLGQIVLRIIGVLTILFMTNQTLGKTFIVWTLSFTLWNILWSQIKLKFDLLKAELDTKVTARLSDTVSNNGNLKLFAGIAREMQSFETLTEQHRLARYKSWIIGETSMTIQGLSVRILEGFILYQATNYWLSGKLTIGDFVMLNSYLRQIGDKVQEIGQAIRRIYEAMADANEMTEILLIPHEIPDVSQDQLVVSNSEIKFRNVRFQYPGNTRPVLSNFNLVTKHGEKIGIVGPSGGGKSTILKVLVRLYDVTDGEILIDGQNISSVTQDSLHRQIAFVPQDPILFHRTLLENIRYSRPNATDDEVIKASKEAHCHEFISSFHQGYDTMVGERGIKLSGGERQRVAIARAILMDAPILVLDEATSSLDTESETYIQDALNQLMTGRTVFAVAHRLSTIRKMDRIIVIKNGEILEEGTHDNLLTIEDGTYQRLWNLQSFTGCSPLPANEDVLEEYYS
jgi:ATP-binding cassette, subfamily B, bacterial